MYDVKSVTEEYNIRASVCLFFRIIRLISPNLNYLIVAGGMMLYGTAYFFAFSSTNPDLITLSCNVSLIAK